MKKTLCFIIVLALIVLSACGGSNQKPTEDESKAESNVQSGRVDESLDASVNDYSDFDEESAFLSVDESSEEKLEVITSGDYGYVLVNTVAMICAYSGTEAELELPSELDGYTVTAIMDDAFSGNGSLKRLSLSDTVVNVSEGAFAECTALEYVYVGSSVAVMDSAAFAGCVSLKEIEVSASNKSFSSAEGVLYNGDKSELIRCPQATEVEELEIADTVLLIKANAFASCKGLKKVVLPVGCQLEEKAFFHCMDLSEIEFGEGLEAIPAKSFFGCVMLEEINVPMGVKIIGDYAFFGCISVKSAALPETVEEIGEHVFKSCSALKEIKAEGEYCKSWYADHGKNYINT